MTRVDAGLLQTMSSFRLAMPIGMIWTMSDAQDDIAEELGSITSLLRQTREGDHSARSELLGRIYDELRRMAERRLGRAAGELLQPTALANAACERLLLRETWPAADRSELFRIVGSAVRDAFVEHLRREGAVKRGGRHRRVEFNDQADERMSPVDLIDLNDALASLSGIDPDGAEVVKLRFFAGCTLQEVAETMGCSLAVTRGHWDFARAWLHERLADGAAE